MKTALLLLEMQNDYLPHGRKPLEKTNTVIAHAQTALHAFRTRLAPIIHLQQISTQPNASYLLPCTKGAEFIAETKPLANEIVIKKHYPNSFKDTTLLATLQKQQVKHLVLCGMTTQLAIDATVRAAYDLDFSCTILQDATAAHALTFNQAYIAEEIVHQTALAALQAFYANTLSTSQYLQLTSKAEPKVRSIELSLETV